MDDLTSATTTLPYKKRRTQGACDICKQKKVKCDSAMMPGNRCSNCIAFGSECTHVAAKASKRRNLQNTQQFDEASGDDNVETTQSLISGILSPNGVAALPSDPLILRNTLRRIALYARSLETEVMRLKQLQAGSSRETSVPSETSLSTLEDDTGPELPFAEDIVDVTEELKWLTINATVNNRSFGQSSGVMLVKEAMNAKTESGLEASDATFLKGRKRPEFWTTKPWETEPPPQTPLEFPPIDLLQKLLHLYFTSVHPHVPLLHRPSIEASVEDGLHIRDRHFGYLILVLCSMASRYTHDPRVYINGIDSTHGAGWKYFSQVDLVLSANSPHLTSLYQLQALCISVLYRCGTSISDGAWLLVSMGTRYCHEIGVHRRRKNHNHKHTIEDELWKRAFWTLVSMDAIICSHFGRPRCTNPDDYDLDLPVNCDEEYWDHPDPQLAWKQPEGTPSISHCFIFFIKLVEILGFAQRTIYSVKRASIGDQVPQKGWDQKIVAQLDSALNAWIDSLPDHLRWDPHRDVHPFFDQSASLYGTYYHVQMQIHRPFIPALGKQSPVSFPSLAICANAARSCVHIIEVHCKKGYVPLPHIQGSVFASAITLLVNVWGAKRSGLSVNLEKEMADVQKVVNMLQQYERSWYQAGQFRDILYELSSIGELPLQERSPPSNKRPREDEPITPESFDYFALPMYGAELGRIPINAPFDSFDKIQGGGSTSFVPSLGAPAQGPEFHSLLLDHEDYYIPSRSGYLSTDSTSGNALFGAPGDPLSDWMSTNVTNSPQHRTWTTWQTYLNALNDASLF